MRRTDLEMLQLVIADQLKVYDKTLPPGSRDLVRSCFRALVESLCVWIAITNPKFDADRFRRGCGLD
jgi:hypothetical protein